MPDLIEFGNHDATDDPEDFTFIATGGGGSKPIKGALDEDDKKLLEIEEYQWALLNCTPGIAIGYEIIRHKHCVFNMQGIKTEFTHEVVLRLYVPAMRAVSAAPMKATLTKGALKSTTTCYACDPRSSKYPCYGDEIPNCQNGVCVCVPGTRDRDDSKNGHEKAPKAKSSSATKRKKQAQQRSNR